MKSAWRQTVCEKDHWRQFGSAAHSEPQEPALRWAGRSLGTGAVERLSHHSREGPWERKECVYERRDE
jgi:hypothetical protein